MRSSHMPLTSRSPVLLLLIALITLTSFLTCPVQAETLIAGDGGLSYDPRNEAVLERISRYVQRRFLSKTDEAITEARLLNAASLRPTFHPAINVIRNVNGAQGTEDILKMPSPPPRLPEGVNPAFPWLAARGKAAAEWKVWVVLALEPLTLESDSTAPEGDPTSRIMNSIYNKTVGFIKDEGQEDDSALSSFLLTVQDIFAGTSQYAAAREDDEGRDAAHSPDKQRQERAQESRTKARDYHYAVVDFTHEPDLMWHWWIWKVPVILFITPSTSPDRSYDIRYWKVAFITGLDSEKLLHYIGSDLWLERLPVWESSLAPGGSRSHLPLMLARPSNWAYDRIAKVPSWLFAVISTALGGSLIQILHSRSAQKEEEKKKKKRKVSAERARGKSTGVAAAPTTTTVRRK